MSLPRHEPAFGMSLPSPGAQTKTEALLARWRSFRQKVRNDDLFLIFLAVLAGMLAAAGVIAMRWAVSLLHQILYGVGPQDDALQQAVLAWWRPFVVLGAGGLAYGIIAFLLRRWRKHEALDVIEANALHGGIMSLKDSLIVSGLTVGAVGLGASVGLEAGVTQFGGAVASSIGRRLHAEPGLAAHHGRLRGGGGHRRRLQRAAGRHLLRARAGDRRLCRQRHGAGGRRRHHGDAHRPSRLRRQPDLLHRHPADADEHGLFPVLRFWASPPPASGSR